MSSLLGPIVGAVLRQQATSHQCPGAVAEDKNRLGGLKGAIKELGGGGGDYGANISEKVLGQNGGEGWRGGGSREARRRDRKPEAHKISSGKTSGRLRFGKGLKEGVGVQTAGARS